MSKPITAVATMKLVEEGRLSLDDRAAGLLEVTPTGGTRVAATADVEEWPRRDLFPVIR